MRKDEDEEHEDGDERYEDEDEFEGTRMRMI